jgi:hypothetical protein
VEAHPFEAVDPEPYRASRDGEGSGSTVPGSPPPSLLSPACARASQGQNSLPKSTAPSQI